MQQVLSYKEDSSSNLCQISGTKTVPADAKAGLLNTCDHLSKSTSITNEPRCEKNGLRGFRPGLIQTGLYSYGRWLEA